MHSFAKPYLLFCYLWVHGGAIAQSNYAFEALTTREGLSQNVVFSIYQDRKGLMWFGTYDGLNQYDGYRFRIYKNDPDDAHSLPSNSISTIMQDSAGRYWVGTSEGCGILEPATGRFDRIPFGKASFRESIREIVDIGRGRMLIVNVDGEPFLFDAATNTVRLLRSIDKNGDSVKINLSYYLSVANFQYGGIFFSYRQGKSLGLHVKFDADKAIFYELNPDSIQAFQSHILSAMAHLLDKEGKLWTSSHALHHDSDGIAIYPQNSKAHIKNWHLLKGKDVSSMAEDRQGNIWLTAGNEGLFQYNKQQKRIIDLMPDEQNKTGCITVFADRTGVMWIATRGRGVLKYNPVRQQFQNYTFSGKAKGLYKSIVLGLTSFKKNELLIYHDFGDTISSILNMESGKIRHQAASELKNDMLVLLDAMAFEADKEATASFLLRSIFPQPLNGPIKKHLQLLYAEGAFRYIRPALYNLSIKDADFYLSKLFVNATVSVDSLSINSAEVQGDTLWICNESEGLLAVDMKRANTVRYLHEGGNAFSISTNRTKAVLVAADGNLWVATANGLNYFDKASGKFYRYGEGAGLCHRTIYAMTYDKRGRIWLGIGNGLSCFDTAARHFTNFSEKDGLINTEYNRNSAYTSPEGWVYMGGMNGVDYFHPDQLTYTATPPAVLISGFSVYNRPLPVDSLPVLAHTDNQVSISFTSPDYQYPAGTKFLYKLQGIDQGWVSLQGTNTATYSNLPPGRYTFQVKARSHQGAWSNAPATLTFIIRLPWWQQWWFYITLIVAISLVASLFVRSYIRRKLEKQKVILEKRQAIEGERLRISTELHDDVGGELSTIRLLSEMAQMANAKNPELQFSKISASSAELVQKLNEIVWALNVANDTLQSLISYMHRYSVKYLDDVGINCHFTQPNTIPALEIDGAVRRNIFLLVKEALNNIVKHAAASCVTITVETDSHLRITIQDNGKGIAPEKLTAGSGNGLFTMQKRAKDLAGTVQITNGSGTTVKFEIPLAQTHTKV